MNLQVGDLLEMDMRPKFKGEENPDRFLSVIRVLAFDTVEVFYDVELSHGEWIMDKITSRHQSFYRIALDEVLKYGNKVGSRPLAPSTLNIIRPELIFRIGRIEGISWDSTIFQDKEKYINHINSVCPKEWHSQRIDSAEVFLRPYKLSKTILVTAEGGNAFFASEIVWSAALVQQQQGRRSKSDGIGIFRSGVKDKLPVYYLGDYIDMANFLTR